MAGEVNKEVNKIEVEARSEVIYLFEVHSRGWRTRQLMQLWVPPCADGDPSPPQLTVFSSILRQFGFCIRCGCSVDEVGPCETCLERYLAGGSFHHARS